MKSISERVILTNQCNCDCVYCYQTNKPDWILSYDIAKKRIDELKQMVNNKEVSNVFINLFGGEPMLNWTVFELYLLELGNRSEFLLNTITNGTLINQEKIDVIKKYNNFTMFISYDGREKEPARFIKSYGPVNDLVEYNIKLLISNEVYPTIRMGVGKNNFDELENNLIHLKNLGVRDIIVQTIIGEGYDLTLDEAQQLINICDKHMTLDFRIKTFCKHNVKLKETKIRREGTSGSNGIYTILQANGVMYIKNIFEKTDLLDSEAYLVRYDDPNLKYIGIPEITDYNTTPKRHKIIKK